MSPKTILSLFDYSGEWSKPYADAGHTVYQIDEKIDPELLDVRKLSVEYFTETLGIEWVDGILAAPPCTDFTRAGAAYWAAKDADGRTAMSAELVRQVLRCVEYWKPDFWVMENPLGRLPKVVGEVGPASCSFHPCDFTGWLDLTKADLARLEKIRATPFGQITKADCEHVMRCNAYTKQTLLRGHFNNPEVRGMEAVKVCPQGSPLQRLGGKSEQTKAARSETPEGFARAFYAANDWSPFAVLGWGGTSLDRIEAEEAAMEGGAS